MYTLFILQYVSPLLFEALEICKLHEISYEKLHIKWCKFYQTPMITYKFEIQKCGQILCAHKPCFLIPGHIIIICL